MTRELCDANVLTGFAAMKRRGGVILFLFLLASWAGIAGAQGEWTLRLKEELIDIQNREPLALANFLPCSEAKAFGEYVPLPEAKVEGQGEILFYYEPINYFTKREGSYYEVWLVQDVVVLDQRQREVFRQEGALEIHLRKLSPVFDLYAISRLKLQGIAPGKYTFRVVIHDLLKGTSAAFDHPFEVTGGGG